MEVGPTPPPARPRRRRAARVLLGIAVALLLAEAVARIFLGNLSTLDLLDLQPGDGRCMGLRPGVQVEYTGWMLKTPPVTHDVNGLGYRGAERAPGDAPGVRRVAVLGDSFVYGHGVESGQTIPVALEERLRAGAGGPVEVLNFGIPGTNLDDQVLQYRHFAARWKAGLVVLVLGSNDLERSVCGTAGSAWQALRHVYLLRMAVVLGRLGAPLLFAPEEGGPPPPEHLRRDLAELAAEAGRQGVRLAVVVLGDPLAGDRHDRGRRAMDLSACAILDELGIPRLDVAMDCGPGPVRVLETLPREGHLAPAANAEVARDIGDWILRESLLVPAPSAP